jgi:hypothetical protein
LASGFVIFALLAVAAAPALGVAFALAAVCFGSDFGRQTAALPPCSVPAQSASNRIGISVSYYFVGFDPAALPHLLPYTPGDYIASVRKNGYDSRAFLFDGTGRERPLGFMFALLVLSHCCQHRIETEVARFFISNTG